MISFIIVGGLVLSGENTIGAIIFLSAEKESLMDLSWIEKLGMTGLIFVPFFFLLKWVLAEVSKILIREHEERKAWSDIIKGFQECINEHTASAKTFHDQVSEAHKFQREEHKEMIMALGRINGYKA
jgi:hypothetical protein